MPKKQAKNYNIAIMQPDEINSLREVVKEFVTRLQNVDNEIELLKQDRKELLEEFSDKLDVKTLQAAIRVTKIQSEVSHKDTFELFMEALNEGSVAP